MAVTNLKQCFSQKLQDLRENISGTDKTDAERQLKISRPTIDKYLNGDVSKLDVAETLVCFFSERVNRRYEIVRKSNVA